MSARVDEDKREQSDMGTWAKLSTQLWSNSKWRMFSTSDPASAVLWVNAISFCADHLTDGRVSAFEASTFLGASEREIQNLIDANFADSDGHGGFIVHDFVAAQGRSRDDVQTLTAKRKAAAKRAAKARWEQEDEDDESLDE